MERPQAAYSRPAGGKFDLKQFLQLIRHASPRYSLLATLVGLGIRLIGDWCAVDGAQVCPNVD